MTSKMKMILGKDKQKQIIAEQCKTSQNTTNHCKTLQNKFKSRRSWYPWPWRSWDGTSKTARTKVVIFDSLPFLAYWVSSFLSSNIFWEPKRLARKKVDIRPIVMFIAIVINVILVTINIVIMMIQSLCSMPRRYAAMTAASSVQPISRSGLPIPHTVTTYRFSF